MGKIRTLKYRVFKSLPGKYGARYRKKYLSHSAVAQFHSAIRTTSGMTSIDLGANVGRYTLLMAKHASEVIAFEPDPWTCARLRSEVAHLKNVKIVEAAAGVEDSQCKLYRHANFEDDPTGNCESSSMFSNKVNVTTDGAVDIVQVNFIRYLKELDCDIGVLKIDIEGAEVDLLEGLMANHDLLNRIRYIFAETHETRIPEQAERVFALREAAATLTRPKVNLFWK